MKLAKSTKSILIVLFVLIVIVVALLIGVYLGNLYEKEPVIANGIILEKNNQAFEPVLITNMEEYNKLLQEYGVTDAVVLTNNDLNENDYVVDFIEYNETLVISDIKVLLENDGIKLSYFVNEKIDNGKKKLMYFIPIGKKIIDGVLIKDRVFEVN